MKELSLSSWCACIASLYISIFSQLWLTLNKIRNEQNRKEFLNVCLVTKTIPIKYWFCCEGVEFIQLVCMYCIIIYIYHFSTCDWLLIRNEQNRKEFLNVCFVTKTIPIKYWFCWEGVEFIQLVCMYCIVIYIYHFSTVIDFSSEMNKTERSF